MIFDLDFSICVRLGLGESFDVGWIDAAVCVCKFSLDFW